MQAERRPLTGDPFPTSSVYEIMYARFFRRSPRELLEAAGGVKDKVVLDLCGGNGRATLAAFDMGARAVTLVDQAADQSLANKVKDAGGSIFSVMDTSVSDFLAMSRVPGCYDLIICQQAVNYWQPDVAAQQLADLLVPGGVFVFNSFNEQPSEMPRVRDYTVNRRYYVETDYRKGDVVYHIQACEGFPPHRTSFYWISPAEFMAWLEPYFEVSVEVKDKTAIYVCRKRAEVKTVDDIFDEASELYVGSDRAFNNARVEDDSFVVDFWVPLDGLPHSPRYLRRNLWRNMAWQPELRIVQVSTDADVAQGIRFFQLEFPRDAMIRERMKLAADFVSGFKNHVLAYPQ